MDFIIAFIPALGWGVMPILAHITKASPREQLTGTVIGAVLFSLCLYTIHPTSLTPIHFVVSFISGIFYRWTIAPVSSFSKSKRIDRHSCDLWSAVDRDDAICRTYFG